MVSGICKKCAVFSRLRANFFVFAIFMLIFSFNLGMRIYYGSQKTDLYVDEVFNFPEIFQRLDAINGYLPEKEYTGLSIKSDFVVKTGLFTTIKNVSALWKDNKDVFHANLYYVLLSFSCMNVETADFQAAIQRALILNYILFSAAFFCFFMLLNLLFPDNMAACLSILFCFFTNAVSITMTLFLREYQLQSMMLVIFLYYAVKTYDNDIYAAKKIFGRQWFYMVLITSLLFSTGYLTLLFVVIFGFYVLYDKIYYNDKYREFFYYFSVPLSALALSKIMCLNFLNVYFKKYSLNPKSSNPDYIAGNLIVSIKSFFVWLNIYLSPFFCFVFLFSLIILILFRAFKIKMPKFVIFIVFSCLFLSVLNITVLDYKHFRYIMPYLPFFVFLPSMLIAALNRRFKYAHVLAFVLFSSFFMFSTLEKNNIASVRHDLKDKYAFINNPDTPSCFYFLKDKYLYLHHYCFIEFAQFLQNDQKCLFLNDYSRLQNVPYKKFYFISDDFALVDYKLIENQGFKINFKKIYRFMPDDVKNSVMGYNKSNYVVFEIENILKEADFYD